MIADVGQNRWEEIDVGLAANYGWPCREGAHDYGTDPRLRRAGPPIRCSRRRHEGDGGFCAIVGGYVVRDPGCRRCSAATSTATLRDRRCGR